MVNKDSRNDDEGPDENRHFCRVTFERRPVNACGRWSLATRRQTDHRPAWRLYTPSLRLLIFRWRHVVVCRMKHVAGRRRVERRRRRWRRDVMWHESNAAGSALTLVLYSRSLNVATVVVVAAAATATDVSASVFRWTASPGNVSASRLQYCCCAEWLKFVYVATLLLLSSSWLLFRTYMIQGSYINWKNSKNLVWCV